MSEQVITYLHRQTTTRMPKVSLYVQTQKPLHAEYKTGLHKLMHALTARQHLNFGASSRSRGFKEVQAGDMFRCDKIHDNIDDAMYLFSCLSEGGPISLDM